jgi:4-hydroxy-tetrahydrodipicolinate reductase
VNEQESTPPMRVAVIGAGGRMGSEACRAVEAADDLELVARIGPQDDLAGLTDSGAQVAVELSVPAASPDNVAWCVEHGVHVVVGTSGWDDARLADLDVRLAAAPGVGVLIAPNFAIGAVLMMRFAAQAARHFESVEVIELHHPDKVDAPSGTAVRTASLIAAARRDAGLGAVPDATGGGSAGGTAGGRPDSADDAWRARGSDVEGVRVHSVRLRGLVASQEVLLGGPGEVLSLRHDSVDRASFMPGVLLGVRTVASRPGLTVGLERYLDLD